MSQKPEPGNDVLGAVLQPPTFGEPSYARLASIRLDLARIQPFFANLAARLILRDDSDETSTIATDGKHLLFNRHFIAGLDHDELISATCCVVLMTVFNHIARRGDRDPQLWGMACNYIVNAILVKEGIGKMPKWALYDPRFSDQMTVEQVYDVLKAESVSVKVPLTDDVYDSVRAALKNRPAPETEMGEPLLTPEEREQAINESWEAAKSVAQMVGPNFVPAGLKRYLDK